MRAEPLIQDVSDTALMVARYRAIESARPDALFHDRLADRLAGERGAKIVEQMPHRRIAGWSIAVRTVVIDELLAAAIAEGADTVVNLGAGLDMRPYRLQLPASLRWIEVDRPHVIEAKERLLGGEAPGCRVERRAADLANPVEARGALEGALAGSARAVVLTEGVVPYLDVAEAGALADLLHAFPAVRGWIVDYFSPETKRYRRRRIRAMRNAPFRFDPADWGGFFAEHGWRVRTIRYIVVEAKRLGRPIPLPLVAKIWIRLRTLFRRRSAERLQKFAGYAVLEP